MKPETITEILTKQFGAKLEGDAIVVQEGAEITIFASLTGETLSVPRVTRLILDGAMVFAETARGERFALAADDVRALKVDRTEHGRKDRNAGFGR